MLPREKGGVVDPQLKVYGTTNLRVADLSIVPLHFASHSQCERITICCYVQLLMLSISTAVAYAIGEKGSFCLDFLLRKLLKDNFSCRHYQGCQGLIHSSKFEKVYVYIGFLKINFCMNGLQSQILLDIESTLNLSIHWILEVLLRSLKVLLKVPYNSHQAQQKRLHHAPTESHYSPEFDRALMRPFDSVMG